MGSNLGHVRDVGSEMAPRALGGRSWGGCGRRRGRDREDGKGSRRGASGAWGGRLFPDELGPEGQAGSGGGTTEEPQAGVGGAGQREKPAGGGKEARHYSLHKQSRSTFGRVHGGGGGGQLSVSGDTQGLHEP